ncbi:MAG: hypothetical protein SFW67_35440 [Myxococcaceae bacterium]|nr:hypothetical protein [Myxococcaceae bacterium]
MKDTGAVLACRRIEDGLWDYVPDAQESLYREELQREVRTVYLCPSVSEADVQAAAGEVEP